VSVKPNDQSSGGVLSCESEILYSQAQFVADVLDDGDERLNVTQEGCSPQYKHKVDPELDHLALNKLMLTDLNNIGDVIIICALTILDTIIVIVVDFTSLTNNCLCLHVCGMERHTFTI
jgi:hypothetical protein